VLLDEPELYRPAEAQSAERSFAAAAQQAQFLPAAAPELRELVPPELVVRLALVREALQPDVAAQLAERGLAALLSWAEAAPER